MGEETDRVVVLVVGRRRHRARVLEGRDQRLHDLMVRHDVRRLKNRELGAAGEPRLGWRLRIDTTED
jgi:hypothetical protein